MDLIYWLMLLKTPGVGTKTFYKALAYFDEPERIFSANKQQLLESKVFPGKSIDFILSAKTNCAQDDINWQQQEGCYIITLIDERYPQKLKQIADPPPLLYVRGQIELLNTKQLAIVGSRNPTSTGSDNAHHFANALADTLTITSGMAIGIDTSAHLGALERGYPTIAVCGTGLDRIYPARNKNLAKQIALSGALVSELPIDTKPLANNFPRRNRIITGMSDGVLVVEALIKSGSMISATSSLEQNREVFAIPGSINNPLTGGPHALIKDGAMLVDNPTDIIHALGLSETAHKAIKTQNKNNKVTTKDNILLKYLNYDGVSFDELIVKSGIQTNELSGKLLELELSGSIKKINNTYILAI